MPRPQASLAIRSQQPRRNKRGIGQRRVAPATAHERHGQVRTRRRQARARDAAGDCTQQLHGQIARLAGKTSARGTQVVLGFLGYGAATNWEGGCSPRCSRAVGCGVRARPLRKADTTP
eukprot:366052-Chlamydomonas_euryale.AAC.34